MSGGGVGREGHGSCVAEAGGGGGGRLPALGPLPAALQASEEEESE